MKTLLGIIFLLSSSAYAVDLCDDGEGYYQELQQQLENSFKAPSIQARFELNKECDFSVTTTTLTSSSKSLKDFMKEITDPAVNKASANSNVKAYTVKKNADNSFEQSVTASKSVMTATIVNTCKWAIQSDEKMVYECNLKDGAGVLKNNKTTITCTNAGGDQKKCVFQTNGRAIGQFMKGPCTLAAGGAAETVNGIQRLMEYVTYGKVDAKKWEKPGKTWYGSVSGYDSGDLKKKNFVYQQQIQ